MYPSETVPDISTSKIENTDLLTEIGIRAVVIVAHPDDETLWAGGTMLTSTNWSWRVISLCRGDDGERRGKFFKALTFLGASGSMAALNDGPDQNPLQEDILEETILAELQDNAHDLVITHSPYGEYTRHLRHEEVGSAVLRLWERGVIETRELWMFAYRDQQKKCYPRAIEGAHLTLNLPSVIWHKKWNIIHGIYGFYPTSWEAMTTPLREAFWRFRSVDEALRWRRQQDNHSSRKTKTKQEGDQDEGACHI